MSQGKGNREDREDREGSHRRESKRLERRERRRAKTRRRPGADAKPGAWRGGRTSVLYVKWFRAVAHFKEHVGCLH